MEIKVIEFPQHYEGKVEANVTYTTPDGEPEQEARLRVWIDYSDSVEEMRCRARVAARKLLARALDQDHAESDQ